MRKGQVEFIVLIGIIIVGIIGIVYFLKPTPSPELPPEIKTIENSIINFIRSGAQDIIKDLSLYGGYLSQEDFSNSVTYIGKKVPYWQIAGELHIPDINTNFIQGLTEYLNNNKAALAKSFSKQISIGSVSIKADILSNQINLDVTMPTTVEKKYQIGQPYKLTIPTKIGEIYEFNKELVNFFKKERFIEYATLSGIFASEPDSKYFGIQKLPTLVHLVDCGEFYYKTWYDLQPEMENVIKTTLAHIYMPDKIPLNTGNKVTYQKFGIPELNGKKYTDLEVSFLTEDDFELTPNNFQINPNPISATSTPISILGVCTSDPINVTYYLKYPVIIRTEDKLTGNFFRIAVDVFIKDNQPGNFEIDSTGYVESNQEILCKNPSCLAKISVKKSDGTPLSYTYLDFLGCGYKTNENGVFEGYVPCGIGILNVWKNGYRNSEKLYSSDELENIQITLFKQPVINFVFHEVVIINDTLVKQYVVTYDKIRPVRNDLRPEENVLLTLVSKTTGGVQGPYLFKQASTTLKNIPVDNYFVSSSLMSSDLTLSFGGFGKEFNIDEDTSTLYIYIPYLEGFKNLQGNTTIADAISTLTNVLNKCNIEPISKTQVKDFGSCMVKYEELE